MYSRPVRTAQKRRSNGTISWQTNGKRSEASSGQDKIRLFQLLVCLVLFLFVLIGKGVFPERLIQVRNQLLNIITFNVDFEQAFYKLGESLSEQDNFMGEIGDFCVEVFGPSNPQQQEEPEIVPELTNLITSDSQFYSNNPDSSALTQHFLALNGSQSNLWPIQQEEQPSKQEEIKEITTQEVIPAVGTVLVKSDYNGQPLPQNYTMDQLSLGDLETVTPVLGHINSVYGYRDHPINGKYQFHGGVDIGGQTGDPIQAFASGTVEYVGEDDSYGLYFQLDHGNGVKSFYAHCKEVCVTKGQTVSMGQKVAEVGSSGAATGPHLHLELKYERTHLNPIYYIQYLSDQ
ncbi:MAG: M23 family metallopeptidase [Lawsonibacter sp.]|jgi:murein DD-endopeptidase MepM/ murein hydrolase activator NlpD